MPYDPSTLFDNEGYIQLPAYIKDIEEMRKNGPWKLPLGLGDRFHFFLLKLFARYSWFSEKLFVQNAKSFGPAYSVLLSYLKKKGIYDFVWERDLSKRGYYSFLLEKKFKKNDEFLHLYGQGVSTDRATALSTAIGEMVERVITGMQDTNKKTVYASAQELQKQDKRLVYPPLFHRFLDVQKKRYKSLNFNALLDRMTWVEGSRVKTGDPVLIPLRMTSWFRGRDNKEVLVHATTNGSAGYFSKEEALLKGILEVVQRDGFLVHWLTTIAPNLIDIESLPEELKERIAVFQKAGISVHLLDITSLGVPSVMIAAIGESVMGEPQVVVSGGSALTFCEAIASATKELAIALEMLSYSKNLSDMEGIDIIIKPFVSNLDKIERQLYWRGKEKVERFGWFLSGKKATYTELCASDLVHQGGAERDVHSAIRTCLGTLEKFGPDYEPVVYYPSNAVQNDIGFYVVQVFIPKAFPFYLFEGYGTFDSDRLKEFAASKGISEFPLNSEPHMFS